MRVVLCDDSDDERLKPMTRTILESMPDAHVVWYTSVDEVLDKLPNVEADVVSLDHDFGDLPQLDQYGRRLRPVRTGLDIVEALSRVPARFRVIVHTSSVAPGTMMVELLRNAGWVAQYCGPSGGTPERWLKERWLRAVLGQP